ncbi:hypothetical protein BGZ98_001817 [Dissophora globulifera]|nr:hypothetical protein BGZ98_001817 [Dissophora globulifera]
MSSIRSVSDPHFRLFYTGFVNKDITHVQLPAIVPVLFPELLRIVSSDQVSNATVSIDAVEMLYTIKEEHPDAVKSYLTPIFGQWNDVFLNILNKRTPNISEIEVAEWGLKTEIVKCINSSMQGFPKLTASYILPVLSTVWQDLIYLRPRFLQDNIGNADSAGDTYQDSDGETIGFEALLFVQFEFVQMACRRRKITRSAFVGEDGKSGIIHELVWCILTFSQMTDDQAESWNSDPNHFIADEDDDSLSFNLRIAAQEVISTLVDDYEEQTLEALSMGVNKEVTLSMEERSTGNLNWWKLQESSLLAVGLVSGLLCSLIKGGVVPPIDIRGLFDHVVLTNLSAHDFPFLQGRSFVFASQFAPILPASLASQYVSAAVEAILNAPSAVVKVSALKALNNFNQFLDKQYVLPHQRSIIQGVAPMIEVTTEETLSLIFRTLATTSKIDENVAAEYESILGPLALDTWTKFPAEHAMSADVMDFIDTLAANPHMNPALSARAMPALLNVISLENPDRGMVAAAIDLLRSLVLGSLSPLPAGRVAQFFPRVMSVLLNSDDGDILQSGQEFLKIAIQKDVQQIAEWNDAESGKNGLDLLIQFVAKLLDPAQTESAALFVGDLISKLIKKGGHRITSILPQLLNAVTVRLVDAKLPSFIQLCLDQHGVVVDFLSGINVNGRSGLDIVLTTWLSNHTDFQGLYHQKLRLTQWDESLLLVPNRYTMTVVPVKIVKLLATDLINRVEDEGLDGFDVGDDLFDEGDLYDDDDEDEDEDDEDVEDDGWEAEESSKGRAGKQGRVVREGPTVIGLPREMFGGDEGYDGEDEEVDADVMADPIYHMNMKDFLMEFFQSQLHSPVLLQCVQELNEEDKRMLTNVLEKRES